MKVTTIKNLSVKNLSSQTVAVFWLSASIFSSCSAALAQSVDQNELLGLNNQGVSCINKEDFKSAIVFLEKAVALDPTYKFGRKNLSIAYNNYAIKLVDTPLEAAKYLHKAVLLSPTDELTQKNLAGIIQKMGKDPKKFDDRVALGDSCRKVSDFVGAIVEYLAALDIRESARVRENLGDVYRVRSENDHAIDQYQKGCELANTASMRMKLAQAYQAIHDLPKAIVNYQTAITLKPKDNELRLGLVSVWEQAIDDSPAEPSNHLGLGQALQGTNDWERAESEYKRAIALSPNRQNDIAEKLLAVLPSVRSLPEIMKHVNKGVDLQEKKHYAEAIDSYKWALQLCQESKMKSQILVNIGSAYQASGKFSEAIATYRQALLANDNNLEAKKGLASLGDSEKK